MIFAIDPGNQESACVSIGEELKPLNARKAENNALLEFLRCEVVPSDIVVIEMVASYGMPVGAEVFETCVWIGRFSQLAFENGAFVHYVKRMQVKQHICHDSRARDSNIRQALIDRFGPVGTKNNPGWFYGFAKDLWSAYAVGITWIEGV